MGFFKKSNDTDKICASHILIPSEDPQHNISKEQINQSVNKLEQDLQNDPSMFGRAAFQFSADPSGKNNPKLSECVGAIDAGDPEKNKKAVDCVDQYGGDLDCFDEDDVIPEFGQAVKGLQPGEIGHVQTKFGHHIIQRKNEL